MRLLLSGIFMVALSFSLNSETFFVPKNFQKGQIIEQIILISDVDGVIREGTESKADILVVESLKELLQNKNVDLSFISGTPIETDRNLESWRQGNLPLNQIFGQLFAKEISEKRVSIFGVLGGHKMKEDGSLEVVDEYSPEHSWHLGKLLIQAFLKEVLAFGTPFGQNAAQNIQMKLDSLSNNNFHCSNITAPEFYDVVSDIRNFIDPEFRLISNGSLIESQTSHPPWGLSESSLWLRQEIHQNTGIVASLANEHKQMAMGLAHRDKRQFNYLQVGKTNKGLTTQRLLSEKLQSFPNALIISIGDTQVDFPMHQFAHIAFHVGLEKVWQDNMLPQCVMVRGADGQDQQHVVGTLKVLELIKNAIGKSFYDFKYIPRKDASGQWNFYALRELPQ
jgi:hypothetical protein